MKSVPLQLLVDPLSVTIFKAQHKDMQQSSFNNSVVVLVVLFLFMGCTSDIDKSKKITQPVNDVVKYARGFVISSDKNCIITRNPSDTSQIYSIYSSASESVTLQNNNYIQIPHSINRSVCLSSTHIAFLTALGLKDRIVGVPDTTYLFDIQIKQAIKNGTINMVSKGGGIDQEVLLETNPEIIFADLSMKNELRFFEDMGIPVVYVEEYNETTPLGRAEWIRLFGAFFNVSKKADSIFNSISTKYNAIVSLVALSNAPKPTIFGGMEYQGVWYVSGGASYIANLYQDAGAEYLFADNTFTGSRPLDFEVVYDKAMDADYWRIMQGSSKNLTFSAIEQWNRHYVDFEAFKNHAIIVCNPSKVPYFEKGTLEPEVVLADFVSILHPGLLPDHNTVYYHLLK